MYESLHKTGALCRMTCFITAKKEKETIARFKSRNSQQKDLEAKQHGFYAGTKNDRNKSCHAIRIFVEKKKDLL